MEYFTMFVMVGKVLAVEIEERFAPARFGDIGTIINILVPVIYIAASLLLLAIGLKGAFVILTAGDNPEKMEEAKQLFQWLLAGFVLVISSLLIVRIIGIIFGLDLPL